MTATDRATFEGDSHQAAPRATHRRKQRLRIPLAITAAVAASATGFALLAGASTTPAAATTGSDALQKQFAAAADEFHVPQSVLLALSYQETRWESHQGAPSTTGNYNVMGLTQVDVSALKPAEIESDGRGDGAPVKAAPAPARVEDSPALHTLDAAAELIGKPAERLRTDSAQSVRGGAALLAQYQKEAGKALSGAPGDWYQALARFSQYPAASGGSAFADRVYDTVRTGAARTTGDGQAVTLAADAGVSVDRPTMSSRAVTPGNVECPATLSCESAPASADNYNSANRPGDGDAIRYIVIHDTEGPYSSALNTFQSSGNTSAHYLIRSGDGHVAQLVNTKDIAWHAGNKTFNMHSVGIEHEGYAIGADSKGAPSWYSEQLYQSSAKLTRYLADRFGIPLDRQHIIGHDDVPKPTELDSTGNPTAPMHWDPGTFWDWSHYMDLLGAPIRSNTGGSLLVGGKVTIAPAFNATNQPPVDGISPRPENFVYLRTSPDANAALINGGATYASDVRAKAVAGASYVVADQQGDWTAIWYDGVKGWFYNPNGQSAGADNRLDQTVLTPRSGRSSIPVYGRAYPQVSAYNPYPGVYDASLHNPLPLDTTVPAGQRYVAVSDRPVVGDMYYDGSRQVLVVGTDTYYPIRYGHRLAFLKSTDVDVVTATTPAPSGYVPFGPTRVLDTRSGIGGATAKVGPDSTISLQVAGGGTGVPANATSVILNVTAVRPTAGSFVTVYPNGQPRPLASNLNFTAGQVIPNLVVVPVVNGRVNFYNKSGSLDLLADLTGYYAPDGSSKFSSTTPTRLLDTRSGLGARKAQVGANSRITLQVAGNASVPESATGVVLNVTATGPTADSFVTVYPNGTPMPMISNLNFTAGQTIPNLVIVPITNGKVDLYNKSGAVDLIADITGYYTPSGTAKFTSAGPTRLLDTRNGTGTGKAQVGTNSTISLQVAGKAGLPNSGVTAVVLNVTAVSPTAGSFVTVYPDGTKLPTVSNLNFQSGQVIPNLVVVPVVNGKVAFYNKSGSVDLIADITGYYTAG